MSSDDEADLTPADVALAGTTAELIGLALPPPYGSAAAPMIAAVLMKLQLDFKRDQAAAAAAVLAGAAEELELDLDDMIGLAESPAARRLVVRAMTAGAESNSAEKIAALGRVLAHGLGGDHASIEVDAMIVAALKDMEAPDIKVLAAIGGAGTSGRPRAGATRERAVLASEFPGYRSALPAILAVLHRHGLIKLQAIETRDIDWAQRYGSTMGSTVGRERWELTTFGYDCLMFFSDDEAGV